MTSVSELGDRSREKTILQSYPHVQARRPASVPLSLCVQSGGENILLHPLKGLLNALLQSCVAPRDFAEGTRELRR